MDAGRGCSDIGDLAPPVIGRKNGPIVICFDDLHACDVRKVARARNWVDYSQYHITHLTNERHGNSPDLC